MFKRLRAWWAARVERESRIQYENGMQYVHAELAKCESLDVFERLMHEADGLNEPAHEAFNHPFNRGMVQALTEFACDKATLGENRFQNTLVWFQV